MKDLDTADPKAHTHNIKGELQKLIDHLRKDIGRVDDPKAKALFETSAEVLMGLKTAFTDYEEGRKKPGDRNYEFGIKRQKKLAIFNL